MELMLILRVLIRRWWLIAIPVVVAAVFVVPDLLEDSPATSGGFTTTIRYTAAQQLDALPEREGDYQDVWLASELTVNAFTDWIRSGQFKAEIAALTAERGLEIDPGALAIGADNQRSIGQIFINWPDEAELATIAAAAIEVLQSRNQDYFPQLGDAPAQVTLLDAPGIAPAPPALVDRFAPLVRLALAFLAGVGLAFVVDYLDPTLRSRDELEMTGMPVLASIPRRWK
jgi:capsular polysaccharide biosynthesis protein